MSQLDDYYQISADVNDLVEFCGDIPPPPPVEIPPELNSNSDSHFFSENAFLFGNQLIVPPPPPPEDQQVEKEEMYYNPPPNYPGTNPFFLPNGPMFYSNNITPYQTEASRTAISEHMKLKSNDHPSQGNSTNPELFSPNNRQSIASSASIGIGKLIPEEKELSTKPMDSKNHHEEEPAKEEDQSESHQTAEPPMRQDILEYSSDEEPTFQEPEESVHPINEEETQIEKEDRKPLLEIQEPSVLPATPILTKPLPSTIEKTSTEGNNELDANLIAKQFSTLKHSKSVVTQLVTVVADLIQTIKNENRVQIINDVFSLIQILKANPTEIYALNFVGYIHLLRQLLSYPDDLVRISGLILCRFSFVNRIIISVAYHYRLQMFLIMCFEKSDKFERERAEALKVFAQLIAVDPMSFPRSLLQSLLTIAGTPQDPLFLPALKLLNYLLIQNAEIVCKYGGIEILVQGLLTPQASAISESILLTCLYAINDPYLRCKHALYGIQELITPIVNASSSLPLGPPGMAKPASSTATIQIAINSLLLALKSWSGMFAFFSEQKGFHSVINMIEPTTDRDVLLSILKMLFKLLGMDPPTYEPDGDSMHSPSSSSYLTMSSDGSICWNNCSSYISSVSCYTDHPLYNTSPIFNDNTNIVTVYLGFIVWVLIQSQLIDNISETVNSADAELLFYLKELYKIFSILNPLLIPGFNTGNLITKSVEPAKKAFQFENSVNPVVLDKVYKARSFLKEADLKSSVLFVCYEEKPFQMTQSSSFFGDVNMNLSLLDYVNGNDTILHHDSFFKDTEDINLYFVQKDIPFQNLALSSFNLFQEEDIHTRQFFKVANITHNSLASSWNWSLLNSLFNKMFTDEKLVSKMFKDTNFQRVEHFFRGTLLEKPTLPLYPISSSTFSYYHNYIIYLILMLKRNYSFISNSRRTRLFSDSIHSFDTILNGSSSETTRRATSFSNLSASFNMTEKTIHGGGIFSHRAMQLSYSFYYFYTLIRLMSSNMISNVMIDNKWFTLMDSLLSLHTPKYNYILRAIISALDPTDSNNSHRKKFNDILEYCFEPTSPDFTLGIFCLCRLKSILRQSVLTLDFLHWVVSVLVKVLSASSTISALVVDILYENCTNETFLKAVIEAKPQLSKLRNADLLIYRLITKKEGFELVQSQQQLCTTMLNCFVNNGVFSYVEALDEKMMKGLCSTRPVDPTVGDSFERKLEELSYNEKNDLHDFPTSPFGSSDDDDFELKPAAPAAVPTVEPSINMQGPLFNVNTYLKGGRRNLEWIFSVPWSIHGRIMDLTKTTPEVIDYIDFDCYPDISLVTENGQDILKIIGLAIDSSSGLQKPISMSSKNSLAVCLFIGSMYVTSNGDLVDTPEAASKMEEFMVDHTPEESFVKLREYICENIPPRDWSVCTFYDISHSPFVNDTNVFKVIPSSSKCVFRCKHSMPTIHQNNTDVVINHELYDITSISYTIDLYPKRPSSVTIPPHLFGALAYTEEGRSLLLRHIKISGWFEILKDITKNPLERRSILWAFTHIAVAPHGLEFLNSNLQCDFIDELFELSLHDLCLSLRGTTLSCISFLSQSPMIAKLIEEHNWTIVKTAPVPLALPNDLPSFLSVPTVSNLEPIICSHYQTTASLQGSIRLSSTELSEDLSMPSSLISKKKSCLLNSQSLEGTISISNEYSNPISPQPNEPIRHSSSIHPFLPTCDSDIIHLPPIKPIYRSVIDQISKFVNYVKGRDMHINLIDLKTKHPELFTDPILLLHVHHFFSVFPLSRTARKFVFQLFGSMNYDDQFWSLIDETVPDYPMNMIDGNTMNIIPNIYNSNLINRSYEKWLTNEMEMGKNAMSSFNVMMDSEENALDEHDGMFNTILFEEETSPTSKMEAAPPANTTNHRGTNTSIIPMPSLSYVVKHSSNVENNKSIRSVRLKQTMNKSTNETSSKK